MLMRTLRFLMLAAGALTLAACGTTPDPEADASSDTASDSETDEGTTTDAPGEDTPSGDAPGADTLVPDGPGTEVGRPDVPIGTDARPGCEGDNPEGCVASGCDDGDECFTFYSTGSICVSSSCSCDEARGSWACDDDCGGGVCVPESGTAACSSDSDCRFGAQWCEDGVCIECNNGSFVCDIDCEFGLVERHGCFPCECNEAPGECEVPLTGCYEDSECEGAEVCLPSATLECVPSECGCDPATGELWCTDDCAPGRCGESVCEGSNPAGCVDGSCPPGLECAAIAGGPCIPTSCLCDADTASWTCTDDCSGGICIRGEGGGACSSDSDCTAGEEWCEGGVCIECDNSGLFCRIECAEGESLYTRNECRPCDCAPINECLTDEECEGWQECTAGDECLDWCPAGDPSCCYGNWCRDLPD